MNFHLHASIHTLRKLGIVAALFASAAAHALTTSAPVWSFAADFEGDLSAWNDRMPGNPDAAIVADPLRPGNQVLSFNYARGLGSIFTNTQVSSTGTYTLSFDYLGVPGKGGVAGDLGGFIGVTRGAFGADHYWLGGTSDDFATPLSLIDDGQWHSYSLTFTSALGAGVPIGVLVEDWDGWFGKGVAGDAYFDNIVLRDSSVAAPLLRTPGRDAEVPEPGSLALVGLALIGLGVLRARGRKV